MAISFNSSSFTEGEDSSFTFPHIITEGSNRFMIVSSTVKNSDINAVSGVSFNGINLTQLSNINQNDNVIQDIWYLDDPPAISGNVIMTLNVTEKTVVGAVTYNGVDSIGASDSNQANSTNPSGSLTTTTDDSWIVNTLSWNNRTAFATIDSNDTVRYSGNTLGNPSQAQAQISVQDRTAPTEQAYIIDHEFNFATNWVLFKMELKPAVGGTTGFGYIIGP